MITTLSLSPAVDMIYFVENFEVGKLYRVKKVVKSAGGKGINVSRVASILGENVTAIGFKAGESGNWLENQLKGLEINTLFIDVPGESRTNINIIDEVTKAETEILETGPFISTDSIGVFLDVFMEVMSHTSVLVCSGGLPHGVPDDFYGKLVASAKKKGVKVILDTSDATLVEGIKAGPYLIKPNLRELSKYTGKQLTSLEDIIKASKDIISKDVEVVVTSMGSEGSVLISRDIIIQAYAPQLEVVNTIGSGDSMVAGFAAALDRGYELENMLKLGMACAASNTQFKEIGYITTQLVEKYLNQIKLAYIGT